MKKARKTKFEHSNMPKGMRRGAYIFCAVMILPSIYGVIRYFVININSILMAFTVGEPFHDPFTLDNFRMLFLDLRTGGEITVATLNTLKYFAVGIIMQVLCYTVAYFLFKKVPGSKVFRFLFFLPSVIAPVISVMIFKNLIRPYGVLWNFVRSLTGKEYQDLLFFPDTATQTIITFMFLNGFGTTYLVYMGAMNRIPQEIIESASLDGCSTVREFFSIIFPLTWGTFSTFLLMNTAMIFTASGPILYFTNGEAKTYTLGFWIFNQVRGDATNYPAAIGVFFTLLGIPILVIMRWIINKLDAEVTY